MYAQVSKVSTAFVQGQDQGHGTEAQLTVSNTYVVGIRDLTYVVQPVAYSLRQVVIGITVPSVSQLKVASYYEVHFVLVNPYSTVRCSWETKLALWHVYNLPLQL